MKKYLILLTLMFSFTASANEITDARKEVSLELKDTVKFLKDELKSVDTEVSSNHQNIENLKETAEKLKKRSEVVEVNPTVMDHGKQPVLECDEKTQNIAWNGDEWICQNIVLKSDCIAASDEYRYEDSNGNIVCKKSSEGSDLKYYWKFEGYGAKCNSDITKEKIYGCYYKDKNNKAIQVTKSHCTSVSKPNSSSVACEKPWTVLGWGACSKSCGGGTQTRSVTCDAGYNCSNYPQPINTQSCNAQSCGVAPVYSCHSYGSGWNLSGTKCYKEIITTKYDGNHVYSPGINCGGKRRHSEAKWAGRTEPVYPSSWRKGSDGSYYRSTGVVKSSKRTTECMNKGSTYIMKYEVQQKRTGIKNAIKNGCAGGRSYNSSTGLCY